MNWKTYLKICYDLATLSPDPSTQNGAIIINYGGDVVSSGINTFPDGVEQLPERLNNRELKYKYINHSERRAITRAGKNGVKISGLIMVCPWACCSTCAQTIIDSGLKRLVRHKNASDRSPERWLEELKIADQMLREARIEVINYEGEIGGVEIMHCGELWRP